MTNKQFWNQLEELTKITDMTEKSVRACLLLKNAYREDLKVIISCRYGMFDGGMNARQNYVDTPYGRMMICYTTKSRARNDRWVNGSDWGEARLRDIMNNVFNKDAIFGLAFNPHDKDMILVMKAQMQLFMPGEHPKPEGYKEPKG